MSSNKPHDNDDFLGIFGNSPLKNKSYHNKKSLLVENLISEVMKESDTSNSVSSSSSLNFNS